MNTRSTGYQIYTNPLVSTGFAILATSEEKILVTMDMSTPSTAGIKISFTGSVFIDWMDGGGKVPFTSGIELTNTYVASAIYVAEITGDLASITSFAADASKIIALDDFNTGLLTQLFLQNNSLVSLDLSNAPILGPVLLFINQTLTSVIFAPSGNGLVNNFQGYFCIYPSLDFTNVPIGGIFLAYSNAFLLSITFAPSGNSALTDFRINNTGMSDVNFSVFPNSDGVSIQCQSCNWTSTEHDNQLINLDATGWINGTLNIITGNTARTAASDAAHANLLTKGWTII